MCLTVLCVYVWANVWGKNVTPTLSSSVALISLLKDNRKAFGGDPMQSAWAAQFFIFSDLSLFLSEECLAQQIPIPSSTLMILIVSVIVYWSVLCVGGVLHTSLSGVIRKMWVRLWACVTHAPRLRLFSSLNIISVHASLLYFLLLLIIFDMEVMFLPTSCDCLSVC